MSKAELNCCWHFAQSLGGQDQGPNDAMGENFKKDPYDSLVREAIQNSIDAQANPDLPVIVTFKFKDITSKNYPQLFEIEQHINGCLEMYNDKNARKKFEPMLSYLRRAKLAKMDYLEVSDENTTGMEYKQGDTSSPFYSFVQSAGNSSKANESAGGSFGFGKAAYFNISRIRTILISTLTDKGNHYFQGVSALCTHLINGEKRVPVGYYGNYQGLDEPVKEIPIDDITMIPNRFNRLFDSEQKPGTSMCIMGLGLTNEDIKDRMRSINEAVVKHFWLAILRKKLIVRVGQTNNLYEINAENLADYVERIFPEYDDLKRKHKNPRPYIDAVLHAGEDDKHLVFEKEIPYLGKCSYYLIKAKNGNDYILNMRSTFMLIKHESNRTDYGFYSVFVCTDEYGNEILRHSENPAHTEWDARNAAEQDRRETREALKAKDEFIQECIREVFVSTDVDELEFGGLDDYISIPMTLDDDRYNPEYGKPSDETSDEPTTSINTKIDQDNPSITKTKVPTLGEVRIKKPKIPKTPDDDGNNEFTGHSIEVKPEPPEDKTNPDSKKTEHKDPNNSDEEEKPQSIDANDNEDNISPDDDGIHMPKLDPLKIAYRAFAQKNEGKWEHHLILHSNRTSDKVIISVLSGGETSDEALEIEFTDNGSIVGNQLTHVHLNSGKTVICVRFADDMRHAIKLNVYETI